MQNLNKLPQYSAKHSSKSSFKSRRGLKLFVWAILLLSLSATAIVVGLDAPADFPVDI